MKYIDRPRAVSIQDAEDFLDIINKSLDVNDGITWGITMKENPEKLIGTIGYWRIKKNITGLKLVTCSILLSGKKGL